MNQTFKIEGLRYLIKGSRVFGVIIPDKVSGLSLKVTVVHITSTF